ncbi:MAG: phospholipid-binding protein MlaC [Alphaproteobacteria bacterium]|jgi:phospholipid transport system substrate-binding protein
MIRIHALALFALIISFAYTPAFADTHKERMELAHEMANMTLTMITDPSKKPDDRMESLKRGFATVVDTQWIAKFVIGAAWRSATEEQRQRYAELYHNFLVQTYVSTYATGDDQKVVDIKVLEVKDQANDNFTTRTQIKLSNAKKMNVDYLVKPNSDGKGYKIIDVIIEGVSLLSTHRTEFAQAASKGGVGSIIQKLEKLTAVN